MAKTQETTVVIEIVNALSGNIFAHKFYMRDDYSPYDLESQDKLKQIRESFKKVTAEKERIFYAKKAYDIFDLQDIYNEAGKALTEKTKPKLAAQKVEGEAIGKAAVAAKKKVAK